METPTGSRHKKLSFPIIPLDYQILLIHTWSLQKSFRETVATLSQQQRSVLHQGYDRYGVQTANTLQITFLYTPELATLA
jgi:hypothetical protein